MVHFSRDNYERLGHLPEFYEFNEILRSKLVHLDTIEQVGTHIYLTILEMSLYGALGLKEPLTRWTFI